MCEPAAGPTAYLSHISAPQGGVGTHGWPEGSTRQEPERQRGVGGQLLLLKGRCTLSAAPKGRCVSYISPQFHLSLADGLLT